MSCHHVGSTNRPAAAPRLCVRSCLSIRSCVNVQSRAQEKCRRCHATRFPDEDSWLRLNLHRILGIPTLSASRRRRSRGVRWARAPARRAAACGGTRQLAPRSHRTRSPSRFGEARGLPRGRKIYLLTYCPAHTAPCVHKQARTRGAPRPDADTSSHVATCNTTWRRGRGASPPSLDRPRDGACAPRDASCMQPHSRTGFLLGWGMGPHCTV